MHNQLELRGGGTVAAMARPERHPKKAPRVRYKPMKKTNVINLDIAFDILFEQVKRMELSK